MKQNQTFRHPIFCGTLHLLGICILFPRCLILKIIGKGSPVNGNLVLSFVH